MVKKKSGITLIALIITIIVLLVLAGVVINLSMGENGVITKAQIVVGKYENASKSEEEILNQYIDEIDIAITRGNIIISEAEYNKLKLLNKPNLWEVGNEYDFDDGVYGRRYTGTYTVNGQIVGNIPNINIILNAGGMLFNSTYKKPMNYCANGTDNASIYISNSDSNLRIYGDGTNTMNYNYDVWILYTKT